MSKLQGFLRGIGRKLDSFLSVQVTPEPITLCQFKSQRDVQKWHVFTDATFGGSSKATFSIAEAGEAAVFQGRYSKVLNEGSSIVRSGYCGVNHLLKRNYNLQLHDALELRVRGDGHTYLCSIRLDTYTGGNEEAWQAPIRTRASSDWEMVKLRFDEDFVFTVRGRVATNHGSDSPHTMPRHNVLGLGITLAATEDMPMEADFKLEVQSAVAVADTLTGLEAQRKAFRGYMGIDDPAHVARGA